MKKAAHFGGLLIIGYDIQYEQERGSFNKMCQIDMETLSRYTYPKFGRSLIQIIKVFPSL